MLRHRRGIPSGVLTVGLPARCTATRTVRPSGAFGLCSRGLREAHATGVRACRGWCCCGPAVAGCVKRTRQASAPAGGGFGVVRLCALRNSASAITALVPRDRDCRALVVAGFSLRWWLGGGTDRPGPPGPPGWPGGGPPSVHTDGGRWPTAAAAQSSHHDGLRLPVSHLS